MFCGVSSATVSRYSSRQGTIREKVRKKTKRLPKRPDIIRPTATLAAEKNNSTIVELLPHLRHTFFADILEELRRQADRIHKKLAFFIMDEHTLQNTLSLIQALSPVGIILLHESTEHRISDALSRQNTPIAACGALAVGRRFSSVHIDDIMATYDGMNYPIGLRHREIGVISDNSHAISSGFQRITGCKKAMEDAGLMLPESRIVHGGLAFEAGYDGARRLLQQAP